ncbi:eukaryotic translation initiation factor 4 gamma 1-like isoform X2 [Zophobas morio]|uniref:eukaryotic translation initiation factor 4 gamma 1-like isoform X2 n=1 Tax=Zophobas morio TaxID=2755281 RepID=UPI0030838426
MDATGSVNISTMSEIVANFFKNNTKNNPVPTNEANKSNQNTDTSTLRTEAKTLPKSKIDITDIVKKRPEPIKCFPQQIETQDKIDRAASISNDNNTSAIIEIKADLPYREGQWAPHNLDGKKVYDKEFLLSLRNGPASRKKPDNLPDVIVADDRGRLSDGRYSMGGRTDFTTPPFPNYGGKSSSQRGPPPKRNPQSSKVGDGGCKGSKPQVVKASISVREDVKLHEVKNIWRPARFRKDDNMSDDERRAEELYKKIRRVLNKLTPRKFELLFSRVGDLQIDTEEKLQKVVEMVAEKAMNESKFSVAYALMCKKLALTQVPAANSTEDKKEFVQFRKLLVTRCQLEFEKQSYDDSIRNDKVIEIGECTDFEKKKKLQFELEEYDRRLRMKSVGNIRFIGELFKQQMLTTNIMMRCLDNLLDNKDEESLECLCKLLTTIGKELERGGTNKKGVDLSPIFNSMKYIVDKKFGRISGRVRFMLQDVIDLRKNKWVPRHQNLNPKTIDQILKEVETQQLNIQAMNSIPMTPRRDDRGSSAVANSDRKRRNVSDDGWQPTASRNRMPVQSDKLKNKFPQTDEPLESRLIFGNGSKVFTIKTDPSSATNAANTHVALEHIDTEKRPSSSRTNKDPYSSKGPSLERGNYKQQSYDGRGSRSGSLHRSTEGESSLPATQKVAPTIIPVQKAEEEEERTPVASEYKMSEEQLERHVKNNLDEYLNDSCTVEEYSQDTQATVPPAYLPRMVTDGYLHVLERSQTARLRTGMLFAKLIKIGTLPLEVYCKALEDVLNHVDELTIDIPMIWTYLAEILVHLICEEALSMHRLHQSCPVIIKQGHGPKLLGTLFKLVVSKKGPNFLISCWQTSGLRVESFMDIKQVNSFLRENKLDFLCGGDTAAGHSQLTYDQISCKLLEFFSMKTSSDDIVNWITVNVGELVNGNKFVRTLVTTIFENSIGRQKLVADNLKNHYKLLQKYVDNNPVYELQCLFALQALIHKMEHPKGLLLTICNQLYEDSVISQHSFIAWEASDDPAEQEGKGVTLKQLTSFFIQLKENEDGGRGPVSLEYKMSEEQLERLIKKNLDEFSNYCCTVEKYV